MGYGLLGLAFLASNIRKSKKKLRKKTKISGSGLLGLEEFPKR
jgi:hypothetical protein